MPVSLLIVEDDDAIAAPLVRAVEREGYDVSRVATGGEALDRVSLGGVTLVLLDLGHPTSTGSRCAAGSATAGTTAAS
ncbi:hypothetical protein [Nocardioides immobilis]|uniref:hypothetical protein n=1 Tax=Nocardioides immobilis TaxID=2049295 RepID=UPI001FEC6425|nr:hypothetical protein [Nocardioides immobilis]